MYSGFGTLVCGSFLPLAGKCLGLACDENLRCLEQLIALGRDWPGSYFWLASPPGWWFALFYRRHAAFERDLCALFERLDARSHWGKHVVLRPEHLRAQYPRWDAFRRMRAALDPDGVLANHFSRRFGL